MLSANLKYLWMMPPSFSDFVRREKRRRAAAPMQLDDFAFRIQPRGHLRNFLFRDNPDTASLARGLW